MVAEIGAAHSYLAGPRIERQGLGGGLYVFFTAVAEGWRGPFLFTHLVASFYPPSPSIAALAQHCGGAYRVATAALISSKYRALFETLL